MTSEEHTVLLIEQHAAELEQPPVVRRVMEGEGMS